MPISPETIRLLLPEVMVALMAVTVYLTGAFIKGRSAFHWLATLGLATALVLLLQQEGRVDVLGSGAAITSGPIVIDAFAQVIRFLTLAIGGLLLITAWGAGDDQLATEYLGSLLLALCGLMLLSTAADIVLMFVAFELVSIPTYILLYLGRRDAQSQEATLKYFFLSIVSSAMLLYGLALLYGATGTVRLTDMQSALTTQAAADASILRLAPIALVLILAGLAFKLAAVPFHFYAPDVYQGTTAVNAAFLAIAPKIAGMIGLIRIVVAVVPLAEQATLTWQVILAVAVVTMTLGNALALWQYHLRRMMAYSSIAHAGYLLVGVAVAVAFTGEEGVDNAGIASAVFYLGVYSVATLGTFAVLAHLATRESEVNQIDDLSGLSRSHPVMAMVLALFMFSLIGIPPLAGFWGKYRLVLGALSVENAQSSSTGGWLLFLAIVLVLNAAISAGYYLRIIGTMYFSECDRPLASGGLLGPRVAAIASALLVIVLGIAPDTFWAATDRAAEQPLAANNVSTATGFAESTPIQDAIIAFDNRFRRPE